MNTDKLILTVLIGLVCPLLLPVVIEDEAEEEMSDYISRDVAIIEFMDNDIDHIQAPNGKEAVQILSDIPAADVVPTEPQEIGYDQCANAILKMWIDNVVTDGEYNRIMDRLNKLYFSGGEKEGVRAC